MATITAFIHVAAVKPAVKLKAEFSANATFADVVAYALAHLADDGRLTDGGLTADGLRMLAKGKTRRGGDTLASVAGGGGGKLVVKLMRSQAGSAQHAADAGAHAALAALEADADRLAASQIRGLEVQVERAERDGTAGRQRAALAADARVAQELVTQILLKADVVEMPPRAGGGGAAATAGGPRLRRKQLVARLDKLGARVSALGLDDVALQRHHL